MYRVASPVMWCSSPDGQKAEGSIPRRNFSEPNQVLCLLFAAFARHATMSHERLGHRHDGRLCKPYTFAHASHSLYVEPTWLRTLISTPSARCRREPGDAITAALLNALPEQSAGQGRNSSTTSKTPEISMNHAMVAVGKMSEKGNASGLSGARGACTHRDVAGAQEGQSVKFRRQSRACGINGQLLLR